MSSVTHKLETQVGSLDVHIMHIVGRELDGSTFMLISGCHFEFQHGSYSNSQFLLLGQTETNSGVHIHYNITIDKLTNSPVQFVELFVFTPAKTIACLLALLFRHLSPPPNKLSFSSLKFKKLL